MGDSKNYSYNICIVFFFRYEAFKNRV